MCIRDSMTTPDTSDTSAAQPAVGACPRCGAPLSAAIGTPDAACPNCHLALAKAIQRVA